MASYRSSVFGPKASTVFFRALVMVLSIPAIGVWSACGGGSKTSAVTVVGVAPVFTSSAPTLAQEGVPYIYQITTTTSDKSTVKYALTTGPTGAAIANGTLTWTPTHGQSRVSNSFLITATTSNNGTGTQSFTVTPTGSINATAIDHVITGTGIVDTTEDLSAATIEILFPNGKGGYNSLRGGGDSSGFVQVPNVPPGSFYLHVMKPGVSDTYVWTNANDIDSGSLLQGRQNATQLSSPVTIQPNVTLKVAPVSGDTITWTSPDVAGVTTGGPLTATSPFTTNFTQGGSAILSSQGDRAYLLHYSAQSGATQTLEEFLEDTSVNETSGGTVSVSGTMTQASGATAHPVIKFSQFDALVPASAPFNASSKSFSVIDPMYAGTEGTLTGITLVKDSFAPSASDTDAGSLSFGLVGSSDTPEAVLQDQGYASYSGSGGTVQLAAGSIIQSATLPTSSTALVPVLTQPLNATIDGKSFSSNQTVSLAPIISWSAPATGTTTYYRVTVVNLSQAAQLPHVFWTTNNSVTLPSGILQSGNAFAVQITAVDSPSTTFVSGPFRRGAEYDETSIVSGTITGSAAASTKRN